MIDLDLTVAICLVVALAYVVYKAVPLLMMKEPFTVYESAGIRTPSKILPPNPGLGSLTPDLLPLDKQNADMRGPAAYMAHGKITGEYRNSSILENQDRCELDPF